MFCPLFVDQIFKCSVLSLWAKFICSIFFLWTKFNVLSSCTTVLQILLQRCYRLVISSLLDLVSRDVPTGYFVSSGGYPNVFCALLVHHSLPCRLFSRDVTAWLFRLYWILFPEMSQLVISSLLEIIVILLEDQINFCIYQFFCFDL